MKRITTLRYDNEHTEGLSDLELIDGFYEFLKGKNPFWDGARNLDVPLSKDDAFRVIYFLQEYIHIFPDTIEKCCSCGDLYDSTRSGEHSELEGENYCDNCFNESEATHCYECGREIWKEKHEYDGGYYCDECLTEIKKRR